MNNIIENVMSIGRREMTVGESFAFRPWLEDFVFELKERKGFAEDDVEVTWPTADVVVRMDKSQLHQVMWNLCENGLRYSRTKPLLGLHCSINERTRRPYVDVVDTGPGMDTATAEQAFEPFYTGETSGTGLGLYIARELCESNQASLVLAEHGNGGCRFRIQSRTPTVNKSRL